MRPLSFAGAGSSAPRARRDAVAQAAAVPPAKVRIAERRETGVLMIGSPACSARVVSRDDGPTEERSSHHDNSGRGRKRQGSAKE